MPSIKHSLAGNPLPDFRNLGVMLRILLGINLLGLAAALVQSTEIVDWMWRFIDLAAWVRRFYLDSIERNADDYAKHVTAEAAPLLDAFVAALQTVEWSQEAIAAAIKQVLKEQGVKMPQLAMPVRVLVMGTPQTPSLDQVLALHNRQIVLQHLQTS